MFSDYSFLHFETPSCMRAMCSSERWPRGIGGAAASASARAPGGSSSLCKSSPSASYLSNRQANISSTRGNAESQSNKITMIRHQNDRVFPHYIKSMPRSWAAIRAIAGLIRYSVSWLLAAWLIPKSFCEFQNGDRKKATLIQNSNPGTRPGDREQKLIENGYGC